jgi:aspartate/tyrosine/aromatic aminotransferase
MKKMRVLLKQELKNVNSKGTWDHLTSQVGMFCFTGLNEKQS